MSLRTPSLRVVLPLAAALALLAAALYAQSATATSSATSVGFNFGTTYRSSFGFPPSGWELTTFDDSGWAPAQAPFGNQDPALCAFGTPNTYWAEGSFLAVRKTIALPAGAHSLHLVGTIDNDVEIYVNGTYVTTVFDGFCHPGGIDVVVPDSALNPGGVNVIAALAVDTGATTYLDLKATFEYASADCKKGGWSSLTRADGSTFKNQGDCVSYTQNGK